MSFGKFSFFRRSYPATLSATKRPHCCRGSLLGSLMHIKAATYDDVMEDKSRICGKHTAALWLDVPGWGLWITTKASWGSCLEHCPASLSLWSLGLWSCPMSGVNKKTKIFFTDCLWPFPNIPSCTVNGIAIRCFEGKPNPWYVRDYFTVQYVLLPFGSNLIFWQILQSGLRNLVY